MSVLSSSIDIRKRDVLLLGLFATVLYIISVSIYRIFFHPLRKYPGPLLNRISNLPHVYTLFRGTQPYHIRELHRRYGSVVRCEPEKLSYVDHEAWREIYGHKAAEHVSKDFAVYRRREQDPRTMLVEEPHVHTKLRRAIAPHFSDRAMREQEPIVGSYVDLLLSRLASNCEDGKKALNLRDWYTFTTFDIIGKLAFSSDFGCLNSSDYHPWVRMLSFSFRYTSWLNLTKQIGLRIINDLADIILVNSSFQQHVASTRQMLNKRLESGRQPDFIQTLADTKDVDMSVGKLHANASLFVIAGSETAATTLTGVTYLLLANPEALKKVVEEVRSSFKKQEDITLTSVSSLSYMLACLDEAMRFYPPVAGFLPRMITKEAGVEVCGRHVPVNTSLAVPMYAMFRSETNFTAPDEFHPERFLGDPRFANDRLHALQPFTIGPNDCVGRNLAYAEMRLVLSRLLFNFDMRLAEDSVNWMKDQRSYNLWQKPPMNVHLTPVSR